MASLRSLLEKFNTQTIVSEAAINSAPISSPKRQPGCQLIFVQECQNGPNSGVNQLCMFDWCVPSGTTTVTFEIWGSGGGGAGARCCQQGVAGGAGAYAIKTIENATPGDRYNLFLGTIPDSITTCLGRRGCTTFITGPGLDNFCAQGGLQGGVQCFLYWGTACCSATLGNIYIVHSETTCACYFGADDGAPGMPSYLWTNCSSSGCFWKNAMAYPGGLVNQKGGHSLVRNQGNACINEWMKCVPSIGYSVGTEYNYIPGLGSPSATSCGGGCCLNTLAGPGMIRITYR
jgi:hypothetical protein